MRLLVVASLVVGGALAASADQQVNIQGQQIQIPPMPQLPPGMTLPPRDQGTQKTGTAKLRGRIVNAETGAPLRRAQVRAAANEIQVSRGTATDAEGRYEFADLPAGRYTLTISKGGYVTLSYGQRRPNEQGKPIEIADGQVLERVDMSLPRGSAITGRVLDEFGEPVAGVNVQAMRYRFFNGQRRLVPAGAVSSATDDLGQYRVYGLPPGEYAISATLRGGGIVGLGVGAAAGGAGAGDSSGYAPTYYPGTQQSAEAQRVTVGVGQEVANISFAMITSRLAKISGTAVDSTGKPLVGESVSLRQEIVGPGTVMMFSSTGSQIKADGSFTLNNVTPGEYYLDVRTRGTDPEAGSAPVTVTGDDINGVSIVTSKGATVRGQLVFEGGAPANVKPDSVQVTQMSLEPGRSMAAGPPPRTNDDWTFEMKAVAPGVRTFRVQRAPASWTIKSVLLNGEDITDNGYTFKGNEEINNLQVILTSQVSEALGTVNDVKGNPSREYTAVVFPLEREKWTIPQSRYVKIARPDQEGRFRIRGLPPGEYFAAALDYLEPGEEGDPELLDRLKVGAQRFSIGVGETKPLVLRLLPSS
jgi:carboxypeptidase family protein